MTTTVKIAAYPNIPQIFLINSSFQIYHDSVYKDSFHTLSEQYLFSPALVVSRLMYCVHSSSCHNYNLIPMKLIFFHIMKYLYLLILPSLKSIPMCTLYIHVSDMSFDISRDTWKFWRQSSYRSGQHEWAEEKEEVDSIEMQLSALSKP